MYNVDLGLSMWPLANPLLLWLYAAKFCTRSVGGLLFATFALGIKDNEFDSAAALKCLFKSNTAFWYGELLILLPFAPG